MVMTGQPPTFSDNLAACAVNTVILHGVRFEISLDDSDKKGMKEAKDQVLGFQYNDITSTLEHYDQSMFIATYDDMMVRMRIVISFLRDVKVARLGVPDSKMYPRKTLIMLDLTLTMRISSAVFIKTKVYSKTIAT